MKAIQRADALLIACLAATLAGCAGPPEGGPRIMSYAEYRGTPHEVPYVLEIEHEGSRLVYYGAAHFRDPEDPQAGDIERRWADFGPLLALNEGGDPPVEASRDVAIGRHAEPGLLRWLAHRDGVPIRSIDPSRGQEVAALLGRFTPEELVVFYVLRGVAQDAQRAPEFRAPSIEGAVEQWLAILTATPGLESGPRTLATFEASVRRLAPSLTDWRTVPISWADPGLEPPVAFTNAVSRASSQYRDRFIIDALADALAESPRVFAAVGASHVVMQEPELRRRFERVEGPTGLLQAETRAGAPAVTSLLGAPLRPPPIPEARERELRLKLAEYSERASRAGATLDDFVWLGRTLAYLHRYHDAIDAFSRGLGKFPDSHVLLRHRGHRYITIRQFDSALADLRRAADIIERNTIPDEVEPDGAPNRFNVPRSTVNTNIYYHFGLAHYLRADFEAAATAFAECLAISPNDDMTVAATHWLYMSLRRAGKDDDAAATLVLARIRPDMEILENDAYHRLCRMYQGELTPAQVMPADSSDAIGIAGTGYGVANWHWCEGRRDEARELLERVAASPMWPAFGVIAAEADLARPPH